MDTYLDNMFYRAELLSSALVNTSPVLFTWALNKYYSLTETE